MIGKSLALVFLCALCVLCGASASLAVPPEAIAIEFTASWCPYCRKIAPEIAALQKSGWPVRQIDVDAEAGTLTGTSKNGKDLAAAYGVTKIPALFVQTFGEDGKPKDVRRIPLEEPARLAELLDAAGVLRLPPPPPQD